MARNRAGFYCVILPLLMLAPLSDPQAQCDLSVTQLTSDGARDWKAFGHPRQDYLVYESLSPYQTRLWLRSLERPDQIVNLELSTDRAEGNNPYGLRGEWSTGSRTFLVPLSTRGNYDIQSVSLTNLLESTVLTNPRTRVSAVSSGEGWEGDLSISPDDAWVAYVAGSPQGGALLVSRTNGRRPRVLYQGDGIAFAPDWSSSTRRLVYSVKELDREYVTVVRDPAGEAPREFFSSGLSYAVFRTEDELVAYRDSDLVLVSVPDGRVSVIAEDVYLEERPAVSSDGRFLAYTTSSHAGRTVHLWDFHARRLCTVPLGVPLAERPTWIPGRWILIVEGYSGIQWDLYEVRIDAGR